MAKTWEWQLDQGNTRVRAIVATFGRISLQVNGQEVQRLKSGMSMKSASMTLPAGEAELRYGAPLGISYRCELRVAGKLVLPESAPKSCATALKACPHCRAAIGAEDRFCDACGKALPSAEQLLLTSEVRQSNATIGALCVLFLIAGFVMYAGQRGAANDALEQIAAHDANAPLAQPIPGVAATTFGELRTQIEWEANSVLLVNLVLAAIMFGLWRWGKYNPGAAIIVAFCTYVVVLVTNAALDPRTIAQGWIVKFIVIAALLRGIKAALALRSMTQANA
jgi:hypothetical protein